MRALAVGLYAAVLLLVGGALGYQWGERAGRAGALERAEATRRLVEQERDQAREEARTLRRLLPRAMIAEADAILAELRAQKRGRP